MAQDNWRFCTKCAALHFNNGAGNCDAGGLHARKGFIFHLDFDPDKDLPDTPTHQSHWRFCVKCSCMFFEPATEQHCAAGQRHQAAGFHFMLPTNRVGKPALNPESSFAQGSWRFCGNCSTMFFDGFPDFKGVCPANGQAHVALGDTFVLPHDNNPSINLIDEGSAIRVDGRGFVPEDHVDIVYEFKVVQPDGPSTFHPGNTGVGNTDLDGNFTFPFSFGTSQKVIGIPSASERFFALMSWCNRAKSVSGI